MWYFTDVDFLPFKRRRFYHRGISGPGWESSSKMAGMRALEQRHLPVLLLLAVLFVACSPAALAPTATATATVIPTKTAAPSITPLPTASPTPGCLERNGDVIEETYPSPILGREVAMSIYLPPCYPLLGVEYPPVYLLHGKPYDEGHWLSLGLKDALDQMWSGSASGPVVVLPHAPEPLFSRSDGGPASYEQEFLEVVLPYVESRYRISKSAQERTLGGISRGGVWALEIGFRHPDLFAVVVGISPSLSVNYPRAEYDPMQLAADPSNLPGHLFLLVGDSDWARNETERLAQVVEASGGNVRLQVVDGDHSDSTWTAAIDVILEGIRSAQLMTEQ
jgi:enterochelin esterase-like enzyme